MLCTINELHPAERRNHIMLSSIWFGAGKPKSMNDYLKPFVNEAKELAESGFQYTFNNKIHSKKVIVLLGICDAVARPLVRCSTQFNGKYGCGLCLHRGEWVEKDRGHVRVYPITQGKLFGDGLRSNEKYLKQSEEIEKDKKKGIKQKSILCDLNDFDIIKNLDVDWMHCVGLGVCRQFGDLWFDKKNHKEKFYFGHCLKQIDSLLLSMLPTSEFSRTPRAMSDRAHFKAHE